MFNKYWREYPWFFQLFQFVLLVFICTTFFGLLISYAVPLITGIQLAEVSGITYNSGEKLRITAFIYNSTVNLAAFFIPCALFAYAVHPRPLRYLGIRPVANNMHWLIVLFLSLAAIPVISGMAGVIDQLPLSGDLQKMKETFAQQQKAVMNLQTPAEFIAALLMGALIAPMGEELFFRGVMMKFAAKRITGSIFWSVLISGVFFAFMHGNVVGFIPLLVSGLMLGYIYYLTGSLVLSMFSHFVVNATQICLIYFGRNNDELVRMMDSNDTPWGLFLAAIAIFAASFYWLWKVRTPLPKNWTEDFTPEELQQRSQENKLF
jgi:uncharacterized protein